MLSPTYTTVEGWADLEANGSKSGVIAFRRRMVVFWRHTLRLLQERMANGLMSCAKHLLIGSSKAVNKYSLPLLNYINKVRTEALHFCRELSCMG